MKRAIIPLILIGNFAFASNFYVLKATGYDVSRDELEGITELVRLNIQTDRRHRVVEEFKWAQFQVQPRVFRTGEEIIIILEKRSKWKRSQFASTSVSKPENIDAAVRRLVQRIN